MTATYTFDVFSSLDGFGSYGRRRLGRLLGQAGPRAARPPPRACTTSEQRMVFGANTYRAFAEMLAASSEDDECGPVGRPGCGPAGDGRVADAGRSPRLAGRHRRER